MMISALLTLMLAVPLGAAENQEIYDVDVTLTNTFAKDFVNQPVVLQVFRIFGRGVDYSKFNRNGFHITDEKGKPIVALGRTINISMSLEASGELAPGKKWASNTAAPIRGYFLAPPVKQ